ncbi:MAG: hypothetical protein Q9179_001052 [Wetmoreana sp. 5 TL-2023]
MDSKLVFINTSKPEDSKSTAKRRLVRSQAAKDHSHSSSSKPEAAKPRKHRKLLTVQIDLDIEESESSGSFSPQAILESTGTDQRPPLYSQGSGQNRQEEQLVENMDNAASLTLRNMSGAGWTHPFVPYPNQYFVPGILSHYLSEMAVDIPELDHPGQKGSLRSIWFPMVIADRATLDVVVLTAATHYVMVGRTQCSPEVLYKLKDEAMSSINRALQNSEVAVSDQLIGAVAKMAAYEAGFAGDEAQYHVHMRGLIKMVELRGGLGSLGLDGLLARMLLWIDLNSAFLLKTKLYFSHTNALPGHTVPEPNPGHFLGAS